MDAEPTKPPIIPVGTMPIMPPNMAFSRAENLVYGDATIWIVAPNALLFLKDGEGSSPCR